MFPIPLQKLGNPHVSLGELPCELRIAALQPGESLLRGGRRIHRRTGIPECGRGRIACMLLLFFATCVVLPEPLPRRSAACRAHFRMKTGARPKKARDWDSREIPGTCPYYTAFCKTANMGQGASSCSSGFWSRVETRTCPASMVSACSEKGCGASISGHRMRNKLSERKPGWIPTVSGRAGDCSLNGRKKNRGVQGRHSRLCTWPEGYKISVKRPYHGYYLYAFIECDRRSNSSNSR